MRNFPEPLKSLLANAVFESPFPVVITRDDGTIEYVNSAFESATGYSFSEVFGKNSRLLKSGLTPPQTYEHLWKTILSGGIWRGELCNQKKSGEKFWESISISSIKDETGKPVYFIAVWQDVTEKHFKEDREKVEREGLAIQSRTDELTGIYNRRYVLAELDNEFERFSRYHRTFSAMMVDVDNFKKINDQYGHLIGDRVLKSFANILKKSVRHLDVLGRYGGDEFLMILPETRLEDARKVALRIQGYLNQYHDEVMTGFGRVTGSIGLLPIDSSYPNATAFLERLDQLLLDAKRAGKNTILTG